MILVGFRGIIKHPKFNDQNRCASLLWDSNTSSFHEVGSQPILVGKLRVLWYLSLNENTKTLFPSVIWYLGTMSRKIPQYYHLALLILRVIVGFMMIFGHGWGKLMKIINGNFAFVDIFGIPPQVSLILAVLIEVVGAVLLIIGYRTRLMSALLLITMLTGLVVVHGSDPLFAAHAQGGGSKEMAILYAAVFLSLILSGGGKYEIHQTK